MWRHVLVLIGICALTFFVGLGRPAITDSDEAFYAESAREMVERGDWLTPHFNYAYRFEKPILYYWLASGAYVMAGVGEGAARFPSALAGLGLTLLTFASARRWFDTPTALLAGTVTATSFGYIAMARQALPDLTLAFFTTLATWSALIAWLDDPPNAPGVIGERQRRRWSIVAAAAAGGALLTKGPVGLALPALVVTPLVCWEVWSGHSRWRIQRTHLGVAILVFSVVTVPWFLGMTLVHGPAYLDRFFISENLDRFATARYNDPRAWWYYLPIVAGGMLPWSPFMLLWLPELLRFARRHRPVGIATVRLIWWALVPLLFFTLSVGKQPRYILPMLCPLAILLAVTMSQRIQVVAGRDRAFSICTCVAGLLLVFIGGLLYRARPLFVEWSIVWTTGVAVAVILSGVGVLTVVLRRRWVPAALTVAAVITTLGAHYVVLATPGRAPVERMASMIEDAQEANERYGRHAVFDRNLVFYTHAEFVELPVLRAAQDLLSEPDRVLCVLKAEDADRLEALGLRLKRLGEVTYLNTGSLNLRTFLDPDPDRQLQRVVLVANR